MQTRTRYLLVHRVDRPDGSSEFPIAGSTLCADEAAEWGRGAQQFVHRLT